MIVWRVNSVILLYYLYLCVSKFSFGLPGSDPMVVMLQSAASYSWWYSTKNSVQLTLFKWLNHTTVCVNGHAHYSYSRFCSNCLQANFISKVNTYLKDKIMPILHYNYGLAVLALCLVRYKSIKLCRSSTKFNLRETDWGYTEQFVE
jgi:hypothetical protein